jgi:hypothetical protein
LCSKHIQKP